MMRKEVAGMAGMDDEIGLGDRPAMGHADVTQFVILVVDRLFDHGLLEFVAAANAFLNKPICAGDEAPS